MYFNLTEGDKRKRRWREGRGRGNHSREAIISSISVKGRRLIEGRLLFEEIRYEQLVGGELYCKEVLLVLFSFCFL